MFAWCKEEKADIVFYKKHLVQGMWKINGHLNGMGKVFIVMELPTVKES